MVSKLWTGWVTQCFPMVGIWVEPHRAICWARSLAVCKWTTGQGWRQMHLQLQLLVDIFLLPEHDVYSSINMKYWRPWTLQQSINTIITKLLIFREREMHNIDGKNIPALLEVETSYLSCMFPCFKIVVCSLPLRLWSL